MKIRFLALLLIGALLIAGCSAQPEYPKAIMVEDVTYLSTGEELPIEMAPEAMVGFVTSTVYGMPAEHGQANFDEALGKAYARCTDAAGNEGIAIDLNGGWLFFLPEEKAGN